MSRTRLRRHVGIAGCGIRERAVGDDDGGGKGARGLQTDSDRRGALGELHAFQRLDWLLIELSELGPVLYRKICARVSLSLAESSRARSSCTRSETRKCRATASFDHTGSGRRTFNQRRPATSETASSHPTHGSPQHRLSKDRIPILGGASHPFPVHRDENTRPFVNPRLQTRGRGCNRNPVEGPLRSCPSQPNNVRRSENVCLWPWWTSKLTWRRVRSVASSHTPIDSELELARCPGPWRTAASRD